MTQGRQVVMESHCISHQPSETSINQWNIRTLELLRFEQEPLASSEKTKCEGNPSPRGRKEIVTSMWRQHQARSKKTLSELIKGLNAFKLRKMEGRMRRGNRVWDSWTSSLTQQRRVWANSGRWWRTRKPGMLQSMGLQRAGHDWVTEQQQSVQKICKVCSSNNLT